jgi:hypothetical protein
MLKYCHHGSIIISNFILKHRNKTKLGDEINLLDSVPGYGFD